MSDNIETLPLDQNPLSVDEVMVLNSLPPPPSKNQQLMDLVKKFAIVVGIYLFINLPFMDKILCGFIPLARLPYLCVVIKALVFGIIVIILSRLN